MSALTLSGQGKPSRRGLAVLVGLCAILVAAWLAGRAAERWALSDLRRGARSAIGMQVGVLLAEMQKQASLPLALAVTATCVVARLLWVFPAVYLRRLLSPRVRAQEPAPNPAVPLIVGWAGMRGVVTLAAALALPVDFPGRDAILVAAFAVILFTVLVQDTTLGPLIRSLRLDPAAHLPDGHLDAPMARVVVNEAGLAALEGLVFPETGALQHPRLVEEYRRRVRASSRDRDERTALEAEKTEHFAAALLAVRSGRSALIDLHRQDRIHSSVLRQLETEIDLEELHLKRLAGTAPAHG